MPSVDIASDHTGFLGTDSAFSFHASAFAQYRGRWVA